MIKYRRSRAFLRYFFIGKEINQCRQLAGGGGAFMGFGLNWRIERKLGLSRNGKDA
jgi:hypothetical protein